ncbi:hypothetical protein PTTG_28644 [Puccinia triticina 1-1 BBBD Race 1]|uniref:GCM domain-containing protein n=1 Tax=Puccinia triticina (isolate 1-1 / race 1 (BBBD)) TaxID=630390 RepID=A0A180GA42_PUCT1|nr:hypothetical protein PTTG_28644 [Puccinia triticina 1-1 BBBD Race 1]
MGDHYKTYIDHGCTLDKQGYPIYPNGRTEFVHLPEDDITNFGSVGFEKTSSVSYCSNRMWKITLYFCLVALVCNNLSCKWAGSPPTGKGGQEKLEKGLIKCCGLANKCNTVRHQTCPKSMAIRFDHHLPSGWGLLRHKGKHPHPWPKAKKPDLLAKKELKEEIKKNPKACALKLKMGKPTNPQSGFKTELGLAPEKLGAGVGNKFILDIWEMWIILCLFMPNVKHFTFQTRWMADCLLTCNRNNQVYSGGLISDVTYQYFETGYLLTTSMFCEDTQHWIHVQLTWMQGLSEEYYQIHFTNLFRQFLKPLITPAKRDMLVRKVVDFSLAQVKGFVSAYIEVFCQGTFKEEACMGLLERAKTDGQTHKQKVDYIQHCYPKVCKWLDWWTVLDIEALLFPLEMAISTRWRVPATLQQVAICP